MTRSAVCVPWRGGDPSRERIWRDIRNWLEREGFTVVTGDSDPALPFNRSQARNRAAEAAGDVDVYVFLDADTYCDPDALRAGIDAAAVLLQAVQPYDTFMTMMPLTGELIPRIQMEGAPGRISGNVIVPRELFVLSGGWDEALAGFGWEDGAFLNVLSRIAPVFQMSGTLVAIEHIRTDEEHPEVIAKQRPARLDIYSRPLHEVVEAIRAARVRP